jgi:hypothetical protein
MGFRGIAVAATALLAAGLLGCTGTPEPTPTPTRTPQPEPTPTESPAALPDPVLPVTCAELVPDAGSAVGAAVAPDVTEASVLVESYELMYRYVGALSCVWGGGSRLEGGRFEDELRLHVLPDGTAAYEEYLAYAGSDDAVVDTAGDRSRFDCYDVGDEPRFCWFDLVVDGYWAEGSIKITNGARSDDSSAAIQSTLDAMAAAMRSAGAPRPLPTRGPDDFDGMVFCATESLPALEAAFGSDQLDPYGIDFEGLYAEAYHRAGVAACRFGTGVSGEYVTLDTVPGAGGAIEVLRADTPEHWSYGRFEGLDLDGLDAVVACNAEDCQAHLSVGGSLVTVTQTSVTRGAFAAHLEALRVAFALAS